MKDNSIGDSELILMDMIWDHSPVGSGELAAMCEKEQGWKKTTVYTMVKRLSNKGFIKNENAVISYIVGRDEVRKEQSEELVRKSFGGSLPMFVNAFLGNRSLSKEDAAKLIDMIENHTEE
ncbi:MAG: BlaI/MecI/CopY family transcriptional regulator [Clostridiales bacterium]|nr:BlaI/MecI/CopY family transcriptional regulator [Clostridiales bacterium]